MCQLVDIDDTLNLFLPLQTSSCAQSVYSEKNSLTVTHLLFCVLNHVLEICYVYLSIA